nr:MAG TPA_asm: hypothetical protein [Caudoviricetes sp.]
MRLWVSVRLINMQSSHITQSMDKLEITVTSQR